MNYEWWQYKNVGAFFFLVGISVFNIYGIADDVLSHSSGVWKSQTRQKHWAIPPGTSYFSSYTPPSALWPLYLSLEISEVCGCEELWIIKQIKIALNIYSVYKEQTLKTKGNHLHSFFENQHRRRKNKALDNRPGWTPVWVRIINFTRSPW